MNGTNRSTNVQLSKPKYNNAGCPLCIIRSITYVVSSPEAMWEKHNTVHQVHSQSMLAGSSHVWRASSLQYQIDGENRGITQEEPLWMRAVKQEHTMSPNPMRETPSVNTLGTVITMGSVGNLVATETLTIVNPLEHSSMYMTFFLNMNSERKTQNMS